MVFDHKKEIIGLYNTQKIQYIGNDEILPLYGNKSLISDGKGTYAKIIILAFSCIICFIGITTSINHYFNEKSKKSSKCNIRVL